MPDFNQNDAVVEEDERIKMCNIVIGIKMYMMIDDWSVQRYIQVLVYMLLTTEKRST